MALQGLYGFVVLDYSIHGLVLYGALTQRLLPVASRGVQLARILIVTWQEGFQCDPDVLAYAERIVHNFVSFFPYLFLSRLEYVYLHFASFSVQGLHKIATSTSQ